MGKTFGAFIVLWVIAALATLAVWVGIAYIILHFVFKFW